jgi:predicted nuclease of restriction endonuclease-like (RecB) superfamily
MNEEYLNWLQLIKRKIQSSQIKAAIAVNQELIQFYWDLGKMIVEKQAESNWGSKLIEQLSKDLKRDFPEISGFSRTNLYAVRKFYIYFSSEEFKELFAKNENQVIVPQAVGQLPWGHIRN